MARRKPSTPDVSIIIPVYNEEALLHDAIVGLDERLHDVGFSYEIIITENGSTDQTRDIAFRLERKFPGVRVLIGDEPNYGKARRRGILEAKGTSKAHPDAHERRPIFRRMGTVGINFLLRVFLDFHGTDTHGLKGFNRERLLSVVNRCIVDKDLFASEFVIRAERAKLRVVEVPVEIMEKRPPSINLTRRVPNVLKNLVRLFIAIRIRG